MAALPPLTRGARRTLLHGPYVIVNENPGSPDPVDIVRACIDGGVRVVQYRAKRGIDVARLRELRAITAENGTLLLVNDDIEAASRSIATAFTSVRTTAPSPVSIPCANDCPAG